MLLIPTIFESLSSRADNTMKLVFGSQEIGEDDAKSAVMLVHKMGHLLFKESEFDAQDLIAIPDFTPEFKAEKSPAQRIRACIYRLWEKEGKKGDFEMYYKIKTERIIEFLKAKLE